jgi:UDP-N-acetylglucosamine--N-acetylmuramyl-(pentapeptide) pyrophosphoryl-undecaprenol N-acetylglucosamine transferase
LEQKKDLIGYPVIMLKKNIKIVLTGGGTAGHVLPHFALLPLYKRAAWEVLYIGSSGVERLLAEGQGLQFRVIKTGKLRRHFSFQNLIDIFWVLVGILQSLLILLHERPRYFQRLCERPCRSCGSVCAYLLSP